ncbi:MAG: N-6 DNA methylase, partial [Methanobacterium sp.]
KLFHETRLMLIKELEEFNDLTREESVHYAQLILNRYMFIAFAEDTGLLTSQISTDTIVTPIKKGNLRHRSIWQRLNELFLDINEGNDYKKISGYNGGLFCDDLDFLKIRDTVEDQGIFEDTWQDWNFNEYEKDIKHLLGAHADVVNPIYKNLLTISSFDFSSELDVNILGHIFENSIGDLEELKEDSKGRRKKDGIFYTPEYITDYICRNTIIPYLSKSGSANTVDDLVGEYWGSAIEELDEKVKNIKIVDPACGSGAFLNKAADVLVEIHQAIHEILYKDLKETLIPYFDHIGKRREILLKNIYGVDLNEESVDITKLSLFLKVSKKNKKLPDLQRNIKCGNSLIDDPNYTDKPFNWEEEFQEIFKEGGFDVIIGNPPYVNIYKISKNKNDVKYFQEKYETAYKKFDLYVLFTEKSLKILKNNGIMGYIIPDKFTNQPYGLKLRKFILNKSLINEIVDLTKFKIFQDAVNTPIILILKKEINKEVIAQHKIKITLPKESPIEINQGIGRISIIPQDLFNEIPENAFRLKLNEQNIPIIKNIEKISENLGKICYINWGTRSVPQSKFHLNERVNDKCKQLIVGKNVNRYSLAYNNLWLFYEPYELYNPMFPELFENDKLIIRDISGEKGILAVYDDQCYYTSHTTSCCLLNHQIPDKAKDEDVNYSKNFNLKYILSIMSSNLIDYYFKIMISSGIHVYLNDLRRLPIYPATFEEQHPLIEKADQMLQLNRKLQKEVNGFHGWLKQTFKVEKLSQKLEKYYKLSLDEFLDELRKKKVDVRSRENQELLKNEYQKSLNILTPLLQEIEQTDKEIDHMVYDLYGLTDHEIEIIEDNLKS